MCPERRDPILRAQGGKSQPNTGIGHLLQVRKDNEGASELQAPLHSNKSLSCEWQGAKKPCAEAAGTAHLTPPHTTIAKLALTKAKRQQQHISVTEKI